MTYDYKNLGCAIVLEAVKEYFEVGTTDSKKKTILKHLKQDFIVAISDGLSLVVAEQIKKNPKEIAMRLKKCKEETK